MLQFVTSNKEIVRLNNLLFSQLNKQAHSKTTIYLGFHGGGAFVEAGYNADLEFWWTNVDQGDHYWNGFNISDKPLEERGAYHSAVNISYHKGEAKRERAGRFAKDDNGNYYLLHSGNIGGGIPGRNQAFFWQEFSKASVFMIDRGQEKEFALVANLNSTSIAGDIKNFIEEVNRIKAVHAGLEEGKRKGTGRKELEGRDEYVAEFWGMKSYKLPERVVEYVSDHGHIVDCLRKELKSLGKGAVNSTPIDLYLGPKTNMSHVFEVKTKLSTQVLYTAIGQLMFHGLSAGKKHKKIFVIPTGLDDELYNDLKQLGIDVLTFTKNDLKVTFHELESVL